jgi:hypothetical protein
VPSLTKRATHQATPPAPRRCPMKDLILVDRQFLPVLPERINRGFPQPRQFASP